ncbi:MAG: ATP-binding protein [Planctomycetota bacterium]
MKTLFIRIFLWFWFSMTVVVGSFIVTVALTMPKPPEHPRMMEQSLETVARAVNIIEKTGGVESIGLLSETVVGSESFRLIILDENGRDLSTGRVSEVIDKLPDRDTPLDINPPVGTRIFSKNIMTDAGLRLTLVFEAEHRPSFVDDFLNAKAMLLRGLIVIIIVGLVCFWLARSLARPMTVIRQASSRVAAGDFSIRLGPDIIKRGDEFEDLGKIFNTMTEQVGKIISAHRRLIQDASHELRSPLTRMNLAVSLARQNQNDATTPSLERIEREIQRINSIVENMLTLTRLDSDIEAPIPSVDCVGLIERIIEDAGFEAGGRNVQFAINADVRPHITGHVDLLFIAFENIIRNALRYSPDDSTIDVRISQISGQTAVFAFRDRGPGIPSDILKTLSQPFVTAPGDEKSGAGLGLSIVSRIVKKHNGTLEIENAPDGGLIVNIRLLLNKTAG